MGQYRLAFYLIKQIGFLIKIQYSAITISIPFIDITIGLLKNAEGIRWFKDEIFIKNINNNET